MEKNRLEKLQHFFRHFGARLSERYGILITFEEYIKECNKPFIKDETWITREDGRTSIHGFIRMKGQSIRVYRQPSRPRALLTALPLKKLL
jgi:hypothetical protein